MLADAVQQNSVFGHLIGNREKEDRLREKLQRKRSLDHTALMA
jgi:hypothetical protein